MSYIPLRDSFDLTEESQAAIIALAERIDDEARAELHKDSCGCLGGVDGCEYGPGYFSDAPSEFVIAWMLRAGMVGMDQIRNEVVA